jgi:hypothetical protein
VAGVCCHEASHAQSTRWPAGLGEGVPQAVAKAAVLLEDIRIERRQLDRRPQDRPYLRASARALAAPTLLSGNPGDLVLGRWLAAQAAALVLGRRDAGVLDPADTAIVGPLLREALGGDLDVLRGLWLEALDLPDGDVDGLVEVATRWAGVLGEPESGPGAIPLAGCAADPAAGAPGDPGAEGQPGASDGTGGEDGGELASAVAAALDAAAEDARAEIAAIAEAEDAARAAAGMTRRAAAQRAADIKAQQEAALRSRGAGRGGRSPLGAPREPTGEERALARKIGEALRRAQFRAPHAVATRRAVPPGRLSGREAMQADAQRSMGIPVRALPFTATTRRHAPEPPITLGILSDVSGSMSWATSIMATLAWAFSHAMTRVHGSTATVAFGSNITIVTPPGTPPARVTPFSANEGTERFRDGFSMLDGLLNLTMGQGPRILVVVSDGDLTGPEGTRAAVEVTARMRRNGGITLWLDPGDDSIIPPDAIRVPVDPFHVETIPVALTRALDAEVRAA